MSSNEGKFTILSGGVPRMQFGAPDESAEQANAPAFRGHQTPGQDNGASHQELIRSMHGNGLLGTATDATLKPTTLVTLDGVQFTLASAERDGMVHRDANGIYREGPPPGYSAPARQEPELTAAERQQQEEQQAAAAEDRPELLAPEVEAAFAQAVQNVPQEVVSAGLVDIVATLADGGQVDPRKFAATTGMPEEQAAQYVFAYCNSLAAQADKVFADAGVNQDAFFTWVKSERMGDLKRALATHANARSLSGYRELIRRFKSSPASRGGK